MGPQVQHSAEADFEELDTENEDIIEEPRILLTSRLRPKEIRGFVDSLKESVGHWFDLYYPYMADGLSDEERRWVERLNRVGIAYFRPLVMAILKNVRDEAERIEVFRRIERFNFLAFRMNSARPNYRRSVYFNLSRALDRKEIDSSGIIARLEADLSYTFHGDGSFRTNDFYNFLDKSFRSGNGYYGWSGLRYLLYEY